MKKLKLTFGSDSWRIESEPVNGKSNLRLFADGNLVFDGTYGELISKIK